ncbi:hypothetical protein [Corynebacterium coyleae]|uniref:hypothetical protein n=1 Tax=Corynebacterium coyleae TaxID=53374 RepID=UPI00254F8A6E|nr:hypothetical protein [Corynebacterium coyleae]MDK8242136.1 hypothetical protein [Corynebacterium coyleae]
MSTIFIDTMRSAWARGHVQQADLDTFKAHGASVPDSLYTMAGNGALIMDWLLDYWRKTALDPQETGLE